MKNKNGFTLFELMTVLVLLGVIAAIAVPSYNGYIKSSRNRTYKAYENSLEDAAQLFVADCLKNNICKTNYKLSYYLSGNEINVNDLTTKKYIEVQKDPSTKSVCGGFVKIEKNEGSYVYSTCLLCENNVINEEKCKYNDETGTIVAKWENDFSNVIYSSKPRLKIADNSSGTGWYNTKNIPKSIKLNASNSYVGKFKIQQKINDGDFYDLEGCTYELNIATCIININSTDTSTFTYALYDKIKDELYGTDSDQLVYKIQIDKESPSVNVSNIDTNYTLEDEVTINIKDDQSGIYAYKIKKSDDTQLDDITNPWILVNNKETTIQKSYDSNGSYLVQVKDNVGNTTETTFIIDSINKDSPKVYADPSTENTVSKTKAISIIYVDSGIGLNSPVYEYGISSSKNPTSLSKQKIVNNSITISGQTGERYLFVRSVKNNLGVKSIWNSYDDQSEIPNIVTIENIKYHRFGPYTFNNTGAIIDVTDPSKNHYVSQENITITMTANTSTSSKIDKYCINNSETSCSSWTDITDVPTYTITRKYESESDNKTWYVHVLDSEENQSDKSYTITKITNAKPEIIVTNQDNNTSYKKTHKIKIDINDTDDIGLSSNNYYQYYLSTSSTTPSGDSWTTYVRNTEINIGKSSMTGIRYLFVKPVSNIAGNISTINNYHVFDSYYFDNDIPADIVIEPSSDSSYNRLKSVNIKLSDSGSSGLNSGVTIQYAWEKPEITPSTYTTVSLISSNVSISSPSGLTGEYKLWVKPLSNTYKDLAGNVNNNSVTSGLYYFDNSKPEITSITVPTEWSNTNKRITINATDDNSGVYEYCIMSSNTSDGCQWQTSNQFSKGIGTYYAFVKDKVGLISTSSIATVNKIETTKPTITLSSNGDSTYSKEKNIIITLNDAGGSGINNEKTIKYGWSNSNSTGPSSYQTITLDSSSYSYTIKEQNVTGNLYLWIVPSNYKDNAGNFAETIKSTSTFKFDNNGTYTPYIPSIEFSKKTAACNCSSSYSNITGAKTCTVEFYRLSGSVSLSNFNLSLADDYSGYKCYKYKVGSGSWSTDCFTTNDSLKNQIIDTANSMGNDDNNAQYFYIKGVDKLYNESSSNILTLKLIRRTNSLNVKCH